MLNLNNISRNKEFVSPKAGFAIAIIAFLGWLQYMLVKHFLSEELSKLLSNLLMGLLTLILNYAVLPLMFYVANPDLRKYAKGLVVK